MRRIRILGFLTALAAGSLSGCAMVQTVYTHVDTFAAYKADEYFQLDAVQKHDFQARFDKLHEWHRRQQLPEYAAFLTQVGSRLQKQPTREDVIWIADGLKARYRTMVRRATPDAAALLATVRPEQLVPLQRQWDEDNRKFMREHRLRASMEERKRARAERALDEIRKWTSNLTPEQERRITALSEQTPTIADLRLQDRIRRQKEFRQLLDTRTSPDFPKRLERYLLDWESGRTPEYERAVTAWWEKRIEYFIAVYDILTPQQRASVLRRLQTYIDDFNQLSALSAQAAASPAVKP